jgi:hypothetical protein
MKEFIESTNRRYAAVVMTFINGHILMSENFRKFYEKHSGASLDQLQRKPHEKIKGQDIVHSWKMLDKDILKVTVQLLEALQYSK